MCSEFFAKFSGSYIPGIDRVEKRNKRSSEQFMGAFSTHVSIKQLL